MRPAWGWRDVGMPGHSCERQTLLCALPRAGEPSLGQSVLSISYSLWKKAGYNQPADWQPKSLCFYDSLPSTERCV